MDNTNEFDNKLIDVVEYIDKLARMEPEATVKVTTDISNNGIVISIFVPFPDQVKQ